MSPGPPISLFCDSFLLPWKTLKLISTNHFLYFLKTFIVEVLIQVLTRTLPGLKFLNRFTGYILLWASLISFWIFIVIELSVIVMEFHLHHCAMFWCMNKNSISNCTRLPTRGHYKQCYHILWVSAVFLSFVSLIFKYFMFLMLL